MRFSTWIIHRKQTAVFRFVSLILAIAPLGVMLVAANNSAYAQTSDEVSNITAAASSPADWTQFLRENMQRWNPYETVLAVNNVGSLKLKWMNPVGIYSARPESSPAVVNGVVYLGSDDRNVYALNAGTGAKLWNSAIGSNEEHVDSSPAMVNGVVYIGVGNGPNQGIQYALDASTEVRPVNS